MVFHEFCSICKLSALDITVKSFYMKKILLAAIPILLLSSCGNSFEREAHHALRDEIKATAKNPDTYKITDEETFLSEDSMVVITFTGSGENGFGGRSSHQYEYIYGLLYDGKKQSCLQKIGDDAGGVYYTFKKLQNNENSADEDAVKAIMDAKKCGREEAVNSYISMMASFVLILKGHNVK